MSLKMWKKKKKMKSIRNVYLSRPANNFKKRTRRVGVAHYNEPVQLFVFACY